jgi:hypothetical protein
MNFSKAVQKSLLLMLASQVAAANAGSDLRPSWLGSGRASSVGIRVNESFLSDTRRNNNTLKEAAFVDEIMDKGRAAEIRMEYERVTRDYHDRQAFGLMDPVSELEWMDRFDSKRREALREVRRHRVGQARSNVIGAAKRGDISTPVMVSSTLASIYFGTPVNVDLGKETRITAKTDFIDDRAQIKVTSNIVDGAVDVTGNRRMEEQLVDPSRREERYRISLSRSLPVWDLSSGVAYGGTSKSMSASIAKPLSDNLTCVIDTRQTINEPSVPSEETLSVQYGIRF